MRYLLILVPLIALADGVGSVNFPVTGSDQSRACFERGVGMLHNFWFEESRDQFRNCTKADPKFLMGYWGEAMTWNYPLWNQVWPDEAKPVLAKIGDTSKLTPRERSYIDAARVLYGSGSKKERERAYSLAMEKIYKAYPDDLEAATFYSLSLIALDSRAVPNRMKAGAVAFDVYGKNPNHPGAAHYIIHAFDDPDHAILALPAARRYAEIAPESHHALHMPSHIFVQLGMWDDTVKSNEKSWAASIAWQKRTKRPIGVRDHHSQYWLAYGYLQQGRFDDAWKIYDQKKADLIESQGAGDVFRYWGDLTAMLIIETQKWDRAATAFQEPTVIRRASGTEHAHTPNSQERAVTAFGKGMAAAHLGQPIQPYLDELAQVQTMEEQKKSPVNVGRAKAQALMLEAAAAAHQKDYGTATAKAKAATTEEEKDEAPSGPPDLIQPTHELYGEILLAAGKPNEAAAAFRKSLERQPNRRRSVAGLAKARQAGASESGQ